MNKLPRDNPTPRGRPTPARDKPTPTNPVEPKPQWERADPVALAAFDPATKVCTMNCGPAMGDPRSAKERKFLCDDCIPGWAGCPNVML